MNIKELADELNVSGKDVIAFLNEKGLDYKSSMKKLSDDEESLVRNKFKKKEAVKSAEVKEEPVKKAAAESKPESKTEASTGNNAAEAPVKKKKNIIIVGAGNQRPQNQRPAVNQNQRPASNNGRDRDNNGQRPQGGRPQGASGIIRPLTAPSPTPEKNFVKSNVPSPKKVEKDGKPVVKNENAVPENNAAPVRSEAPKKPEFNSNSGNRENGFNNRGERPLGDRRNFNGKQNDRTQGDRPKFNQNDNNSRGNRPFQKNDRFGGGQSFNKDKDDDNTNQRGRGFQGGKKSPSKDFGVAAGLPAPENKRNRKGNNSKDKKDGKDFLYEEDGNVRKDKNGKRVGAFVKPETKVVETVEDDIKVIVLPEVLTIKELADKMKLQPAAIVKKLFLQGEIVNVNTEISYEKAEEIAIEYDIICEQEVKVNVIEELLKEEDEDTSTFTNRPPVICVMGHVDHGKTSLLDAIRKTHVIDREAGGITQAIGAYMVEIGGRKITFLDTPGHEAFTAMRMRGANATDIAILVVAADDGVMPQTKEAINHAKAAGVQIIVAVNKVDKIGYDFESGKKLDSYPTINNLMRELAEEHELLAEDWGGTTIFAPVSAKKGQGINELLEMILLSADMLELKANAKRKARGLVIEAELDKGRGPVATVLVQKGTLKVGDFISAGEAHGKVRAMIDDNGRRVKEAPPSTPVEILGLNAVPNAGEIFIAHDNDKEAKSFADTFIAQNKVKLLDETKSKMSLDDLFSQIQAGNLKELNLIVKADVQGSVEAVKQSLEKLTNEEVAVKVIHSGVGTINESDVILASAAKAIIIGFNVRLDNMAKETVDREGVDVRLYSVIYQAIEDVEAAMKGMLDPIFEEKVIGHAEVRQIFKASAIGNIAGSYVTDGLFKRDCLIRITRDGEQIYEGKLASLKRFKDDVKEVKTGYECGLVFEDFDKMQEFDQVEAYEMVEVPR